MKIAKDDPARYVHLGANLRDLRRYYGLSQTALGEAAGAFSQDRIGLTQSYISKLEHGLRPICEDHVRALAAVLRVTMRPMLKQDCFKSLATAKVRYVKLSAG